MIRMKENDLAIEHYNFRALLCMRLTEHLNIDRRSYLRSEAYHTIQIKIDMFLAHALLTEVTDVVPIQARVDFEKRR